MNKILAKIIGPLIFIGVAAGCIALAVIGFLIFWYVLLFALALGVIFYLIGWFRYKLTGQKKPSFEQIFKHAKTKAKTTKYRSKRRDYSKSDDPNKETIDHDEIK